MDPPRCMYAHKHVYRGYSYTYGEREREREIDSAKEMCVWPTISTCRTVIAETAIVTWQGSMRRRA